MNKPQLALILGGITLVILLYQLPRVVVENETLVDTGSESHSFTIPQEVRSLISDLRSKWSSEVDTEKKLNFADSLATLYLDYQEIDSALWFVDQIKLSGKEAAARRVVDLTYEAFQRARDTEEARELGTRAAEEIRSLLTLHPDNSSLKNKLAMTLVASENPMAGIQMLRGILEETPNDLEAIKNLGILSIQSGQFEIAEGRFMDYLSIDSTDQEALFYLGMCRIEMGNEKGMQIMQQLSSSDNPAIRSLAIEYLEN